MQSLHDIEEFIINVLGQKSAEIFDFNMDEFIYYIRAEALADPEKNEDDMMEVTKTTVEKIFSQVIKIYLAENHTDNGIINVNVKNGVAFDKHGNELKPIMKFKFEMPKIIDVIVKTSLSEFVTGRMIAKEIVGRMKDYRQRKKEGGDIPMEKMEMEMLTLEAKLPEITKAEAVRLLHLYSVVRR